MSTVPDAPLADQLKRAKAAPIDSTDAERMLRDYIETQGDTPRAAAAKISLAVLDFNQRALVPLVATIKRLTPADGLATRDIAVNITAFNSLAGEIADHFPRLWTGIREGVATADDAGLLATKMSEITTLGERIISQLGAFREGLEAVMCDGMSRIADDVLGAVKRKCAVAFQVAECRGLRIPSDWNADVDLICKRSDQLLEAFRAAKQSARDGIGLREKTEAFVGAIATHANACVSLLDKLNQFIKTFTR